MGNAFSFWTWLLAAGAAVALWVLLLTALARHDRRSAGLCEAMRSLIGWSLTELAVAYLGYMMQTSVMRKLVAQEITMPDPFLGFVLAHATVATCQFMTLLLVILAVAGALWMAEALLQLLWLGGLAAGDRRQIRDSPGAFLEQLVVHLAFMAAGGLMVFLDARIFGLRWVMEVEDRDTLASAIQGLAQWAYFLALPLLSLKVHLAYRAVHKAIATLSPPQDLPATESGAVADEGFSPVPAAARGAAPADRTAAPWLEGEEEGWGGPAEDGELVADPFDPLGVAGNGDARREEEHEHV